MKIDREITTVVIGQSHCKHHKTARQSEEGTQEEKKKLECLWQ